MVPMGLKSSGSLADLASSRRGFFFLGTSRLENAGSVPFRTALTCLGRPLTGLDNLSSSGLVATTSALLAVVLLCAPSRLFILSENHTTSPNSQQYKCHHKDKQRRREEEDAGKREADEGKRKHEARGKR